MFAFNQPHSDWLWSFDWLRPSLWGPPLSLIYASHMAFQSFGCYIDAIVLSLSNFYYNQENIGEHIFSKMASMYYMEWYTHSFCIGKTDRWARKHINEKISKVFINESRSVSGLEEKTSTGMSYHSYVISHYIYWNNMFSLF